MKHRLLRAVLALSLLLGLFCSTALAAYTDTNGHWAQETIEKWETSGLVKGYDDGTFRPRDQITRAEVCSLVSTLMDLPAGTGEFPDAKADNWFYSAVASCSSAGYLRAEEDGALRPRDNITRQEAFYMAAKAFGLDTADTAAPDFTDAAEIADWAVGSVNALVKAGILSGYTDGSVKPNGELTRAEMLVLLDPLVPSAGEKDAAAGSLTDLLLEDVAALVDFKFDEAKKSYDVTVFEDVYGVRFIPVITGKDSSVKVTMSGDGIETETVTVGRNEQFELHLNQSRACNTSASDEAMKVEGMEKDCRYTVTIEAANGTYTVNVLRPGTDALVEKFQRLTWPLSNGKEMTYWLYIPEDYDSSKSYPVMISPHGGGQFANDAEDILVRTAQATSMVKYGKECIIIAPHGNYSDLSFDGTTGWCDRATLELSEFGEGTMAILADVQSKYNVDKNRIYAAGGSMGGIGTLSLVANSPETFAGAVICCPAFITEETAKIAADKLKGKGVALWLVHAEADPTISIDATNDLMTAFDAVEIDYNATLYTQSSYFWPTAHFCWVPFLADESHLDWLLAQSKGGNGELTDLLLEDSAGLVDFKFDTERKSYDITVFEDVYGVRFTPVIAGDGESKIEVTMSGDGIETETVSVAKNKQFELHLNQSRACNTTAQEENMKAEGMEKDCRYTVTIKAANGEYTINILRPGTDALVEKFQRLTWPLSDGKEMTYWLYIPEDYDSGKSYPVMISPHGGGQFRNDAEDILVRTAQATSMVKYGKECIIIAPHGNYSDLSFDGTIGWCDRATLELSEFGEGTMAILADVQSKYNVDDSRIYVAGGSMGGAGTCGLVASSPETFAAAVICCPAISEEAAPVFAEKLKGHDIALWLVHSETDPTITIDSTNSLMAACDEAGVAYGTSLYSSSVYLYPTDHFSWVPYLDNEVNLDWLLAQSK